jgi:hypothetical protein
MLRTAFSLLALAVAMIPAAADAQSWSFGVTVYPAPGAYYYGAPVPYPPPVIVAPPPPPYVYAPAPPPPTVVPGMKAPGEVFDWLDQAGYRDLSPMAQRGSVYRLRATSPAGHLVELDISVFTGAIQRETILQANYAASATPPPPLATPPVAAEAAPAPDTTQERNPLVVY